MRNPVFLNSILEKTFKINFNTKLRQKLIDIQGDNAPTQIEILKNNWLPKLEHKWQHFYDLLTVDEYKSDFEFVKQEVLNDDFKVYFENIAYGLIDNREDLVVTHNDIQECNILSMRDNATELAIIDYEYTSLGPKEFDLANTFCELMEDNAYPYFPFIKLYFENCLSMKEFEKYSKYYLGMLYEHRQISDKTKEQYIEDELHQFIENLFCCMVINGYYWSVWSILMIEESKINDKIFNFSLARLRIQITHHLLSLDFFKEVIDKKLDRVKSITGS